MCQRHRYARTGAALTMPTGWIDTDSLAAMLLCSQRHARRLLAAWERAAADGGHAPRTQRWHGGTRGRPPILACVADVSMHLALEA